MQSSGFLKLNWQDARVICFHLVIAAIQTYLIGLKIEDPMYAPYIQAVSEMLRRVVV